MKTATTASGRAFRYQLWERLVPPAGANIVIACWYHRGLVRLFDCRDEPAGVIADMLRALGWSQVARRVWVCADCAHDPMQKQHRIDWSTGNIVE
jgi:hypothetical protein